LSAVKTVEQRRARDLRAEGQSIKEIARCLSVSPSSVSTWVRDVELGAEQRRRLIDRVRLGPVVSGERKAAAARLIRRGYQDEGRRLVRERDASYAAGCMLYWAEGRKHRNTLKLTNSDPELLVAFLAFLRVHFAVSDDQVKDYRNLFADHLEKQRAVEDFWLSRLALPRTSLRKSTINAYSKYSQRKRTNKLPFGTCALVVHSTRIVQTIYGRLRPTRMARLGRPACRCELSSGLPPP
jgi:transcriptional regulator with XRE-family HTH domain